MTPNELTIALIVLPASIADAVARLLALIAILALVAFAGVLMCTRERQP